MYATSFNLNSDKRLKKNIAPLENGLDKVMKLNPVRFDWRPEKYKTRPMPSKTRDLGLIAQNVQTEFPELVHTDNRGYLAVDYSRLVSPLIEAVKEFYAKWQSDSSTKSEKLATLEATVAEKDRELKEMKKYLCAKDPGAPFCK